MRRQPATPRGERAGTGVDLANIAYVRPIGGAMRRSKLAALALVAVFLTAACGLRANKQDVRAAERAALGNGSSAFGAGAASSSEEAAGAAGGGAAGGAAAGTSGSAGVAGGGATAGSGGGAGAGGVGGAAPARGRGGATGVRVTASTIT